MSITNWTPYVKCLGCGRIIYKESLATYVETYGFDTPPYDEFKICPFCRDNRFEDYFDGEDPEEVEE